MLAKRVDDIPAGATWIFEPKWDGFRALVFRDRDEIQIQSRDEKPLNRYFPELVDTLQRQLPARCVLDGEIVIAKNGVPRAKLVPVPVQRALRQPAHAMEITYIADDFDDPLPEDFLLQPLPPDAV